MEDNKIIYYGTFKLGNIEVLRITPSFKFLDIAETKGIFNEHTKIKPGVYFDKLVTTLRRNKPSLKQIEVMTESKVSVYEIVDVEGVNLYKEITEAYKEVQIQ
jgi:hypothetical protein